MPPAMSDSENKQKTEAAAEWFVRTPDGGVYGPVDTHTLCEWAEQGRIEPDDEVSPDRESWKNAAEIPELEMDWTAETEDSSQIGPFNFHLSKELVRRGVLPADATITNRRTGAIHNLIDSDEISSSEEDSKDNEQLPESANEPTADTRQPLTSERLKSMQKSASEARKQLNQTRKQLSKQRAINTAMQDNINRLQDELRTLEDERDSSNEQLIELQDRLTEALAEAENREAQFQQLQEHYERLQTENNEQFAELDRLRAETMENEHQYRKIVAECSERSDAKTSTLLQLLHTILDDDEISRTNIPERLLPQPDSPQIRELQNQVSLVQDQLENERLRRQQLEEREQPETGSLQKLIIGLLLAILFGIFVNIFVALTNHKQQHPKPAASFPSLSIPTNTTTSHEQKITKTVKNTKAENVTAPRTSGLDLPPDSNSNKTTKTTQTAIKWPRIRLARGIISHSNQGLKIIFQYGIFSKRTTLSPTAKVDLERIADQLRRNTKDFTLIIEGHTDPTPIRDLQDGHVSNFALAKDRAETTKKYLINECDLPESFIRTTSAGEGDPPFPNTTPDLRRKNRTVVLMLVPRK